MRANHVKSRLKSGQPSVGTWLSLPCAPAARYIAQLGFDWLTVDTEHQPIGIETATAMFAGIAGAGPAPLARVPWNNGQNIKRVLDCGAWGIVVPMVETRAEAEAAVGAAKYPPAGIRSVGGSLHALNFGTEAANYYARANEEVLVVLQIESARAVENADDLLSVPGIDAIFIGPNDLMASMGMTPAMESDDRRFVEALRHIATTARKYGVAPGIHVANHEAARRRIEEGFQFIALASDLRFMLAAARDELARTGFSREDGAAKPAGEVARY
jgi:4-hydroxy-2-oxoheptanedioate aldolase